MEPPEEYRAKRKGEELEPERPSKNPALEIIREEQSLARLASDLCARLYKLISADVRSKGARELLPKVVEYLLNMDGFLLYEDPITGVYVPRSDQDKREGILWAKLGIEIHIMWDRSADRHPSSPKRVFSEAIHELSAEELSILIDKVCNLVVSTNLEDLRRASSQWEYVSLREEDVARVPYIPIELKADMVHFMAYASRSLGTVARLNKEWKAATEIFTEQLTRTLVRNFVINFVWFSSLIMSHWDTHSPSPNEELVNKLGGLDIARNEVIDDADNLDNRGVRFRSNCYFMPEPISFPRPKKQGNSSKAKPKIEPLHLGAGIAVPRLYDRIGTNLDFRDVAYTGAMQAVLMSLLPQEEIDLDINWKAEQIIQVVSGTCTFYIRSEGMVGHYTQSRGSAFFIGRGTWYSVKNASHTERLSLYTLYSTPEYPFATVQATKPAKKEEYEFQYFSAKDIEAISMFVMFFDGKRRGAPEEGKPVYEIYPTLNLSTPGRRKSFMNALAERCGTHITQNSDKIPKCFDDDPLWSPGWAQKTFTTENDIALRLEYESKSTYPNVKYRYRQLHDIVEAFLELHPRGDVAAIYNPLDTNQDHTDANDSIVNAMSEGENEGVYGLKIDVGLESVRFDPYLTSKESTPSPPENTDFPWGAINRIPIKYQYNPDGTDNDFIQSSVEKTVFAHCPIIHIPVLRQWIIHNLNFASRNFWFNTSIFENGITELQIEGYDRLPPFQLSTSDID